MHFIIKQEVPFLKKYILCPIYKKFYDIPIIISGVGISMVLVSAMTAMYYNMVLAWSFYYMFASFTSTLPWGSCDNKWNGACKFDIGVLQFNVLSDKTLKSH